MEITVFSDMKPSGLVDEYQRFGITYCLHLQGRRASRAMYVTLRMPKATWIWRILPFYHEDGGSGLFWNVCTYLQKYMAQHPRIPQSCLHSPVSGKFTTNSCTTLKCLSEEEEEHSMQLEATNTNCTTLQTAIVIDTIPLQFLYYNNGNK
jgi:hypothetical protein